MAATFPTSPLNGDQTTVNNILYVYSSATRSWARVPSNVAVGGSNTQIQYNNANTFGGSAAFTFNNSTNAIVATGNITSGNLLTGGIISATGNVSGGNVAAATAIFSLGTVGASGNTSGGNLTTSGQVSATGAISSDANVVAGTNTKAAPALHYTNSANTQYGALLMQKAGVERWLIGSDNSTANGNVVIRFNATSNYVTVTEAGAVTMTGNVTGGNLLTAGIMSAASHIGTLVSVTGNINGGNLISAGTITTAGNIVSSGANGVANIGAVGAFFNTVHAKATSAQYADVAEYYSSDTNYAPGTVVIFGGEAEVTIADKIGDDRVAGVVSTNPAYIMNAGIQSTYSVPVALTGRVPTKVVGSVKKGSMMISAGNGYACACSVPAVGTVIGKAIENFDGDRGVIEVVVGRM
jgi:hypothetical protein